MLFSSILMIILYLILKYVLAWIRYFNSLDSRLGQSTWRWSYDYPVIGERDISDLDDKTFVRLRRKRNRVITLMYSILLIYIKNNSPDEGIVIEDKTNPEKNISHEFKNNEIFKASDTMVDALTQLIARKRAKNIN